VPLVTQYFQKENCVIRGQNSSSFLLKYRNFIAIGDEIWRILSNLRVSIGKFKFVGMALSQKRKHSPREMKQKYGQGS
jgi:hypothetical protein